MKSPKLPLKSTGHWILLLLVMDLFFSFLAWLISPKAFKSIALMLLLFTALIFIIGYFVDQNKRKKQINALKLFISEPDEKTEQQLLALTDDYLHPMIASLAAKLKDQSQAINTKQLELINYQEFIEAWTHEIKTPISLAALVLDNHREEMSPYVYKRMKHVSHSIRSNVDKILYYARLQADHVDYRFDRINLSDCIQECLLDFRGIAEEKAIEVSLDLSTLEVVCDRKVLSFMLSQLLSNALKYAPAGKGIVHITSWYNAQQNGSIHLAIRDNGSGVPPEDMPFLFDKGFTGNHPDRQNATGMGLYLVKKYAEALSIEVNIEEFSSSGNGFGIELVFPCIR